MFATKLRSRMQTVTLMTILLSLRTIMQPIHVECALDHFQEQLFELGQMTKEAQRVVRKFLEAAAQECVENPGLQYLKDSVSIASDRIWSMTLCGIVTNWLERSIAATNLHHSIVTSSTDHPSTLFQTTKSRGSATCTSFTTATGTVESVDAPGLAGTSDATLTGDLIKLAKCHVTTGNRSSHIYVQDADTSFKYELANTSGDTLLDIRVYPTQALEGVEPKQWWRFSSVRGQIAVKNPQPGRPTDPVYLQLQKLMTAIQQKFVNAADTKVSRLPLKKSWE